VLYTKLELGFFICVRDPPGEQVVSEPPRDEEVIPWLMMTDFILMKGKTDTRLSPSGWDFLPSNSSRFTGGSVIVTDEIKVVPGMLFLLVRVDDRGY
jgi:hypothetical protein